MEKVTILNNELNNIKHIYHCGDIHIENSEKRKVEYMQIYEKFANEIKKTIKEESMIVIAGDLIDFKECITLDGLNMTILFIKYFVSLDIPIIMISGNHDANEKNIEDKDLIGILNNLKIDNFYYLKKSGLYKYNNIIFSVASIFDREIINVTKIPHSNEKLICLHHGKVIEDKKDPSTIKYIKGLKYFKTSSFTGYDIVMLGDIHTENFIKPNIAYSTSLIQRNFGEPLSNHGFILWDLEKNTGKHIELANDYGQIIREYSDGKCKNKLSVNEMKKLPKNISIIIKTDNTTEDILDNEIDTLSKYCNIISKPIIKQIKMDYNIEIDGIKITNFDLTDVSLVTNMIKHYMKTTLKIESEEKIKEIIDIHIKYHNIVNIKKQIKSRRFKKIKLTKLKFDNVLSFGENNVFDFEQETLSNILIEGQNGHGKSAILDILTYSIYGRPIRASNGSGMMNVNKDTYIVELIFVIDDINYRISRNGERKNNSIDENILVFENDDNISKKNKKNIQETIENIIGLDFQEFCFFCLMSSTNEDILDLKNIERKTLMSNILNIDYMEYIEKIVKDEIIKLQDTFNKNKYEWQTIINKYNEGNTFDIKDLEKAEKQLEKSKKSVTKLKSDLEKKRKELKYIDNDDDIDEIKEDIKILKTKIIDETKQLKKITLQMEKEKDTLNIIPVEIKKEIWDVCQNKWNDELLSDIEKILMKLIIENNEIIQQNYKIKIILLNNKNETEQNILKYENDLSDKIKKQEQYNKNKLIIKNNSKIENQIDIINTQITNEEITIEQLKIKINKLKELKMNSVSKEQYMEINTKYEQQKYKIEIFELYKKIININAFPASIMKIACEHLEKMVSSLLEGFGLDFSIKFNISTTTTEKRKDLQTVIDIYKYTKKHRIMYSHLASTSEKFMINLAFKLAVMNMFKISIPKILMIDEKFENVDINRRQYINQIINVINSIYDNIYMISHLRETAELCNRSITIKKKDEYSYIS